jgi:hypothetical protein
VTTVSISIMYADRVQVVWVLFHVRIGFLNLLTQIIDLSLHRVYLFSHLFGILVQRSNYWAH